MDTAALPFWRNQKSNGRHKPLGKFSVDFGARGLYDRRNPLNDLTGREWTYFLNSVWITAYPPVAGNGTAFNLRKIHPSPKPPELMRDIILFFTKGNQRVLDPFAGVGGTFLGAAMCEAKRDAVGIELNNQYIDAYNEVCEVTSIAPQRLICDDARNMLNHEEIMRNQFDLILSDPPYCNMMTKPKNGHKRKLYGRNDPTPFSSDPNDLGNLSFEDFSIELRKIIEIAITRLKPKKYVVLFCRDLQPTREKTHLLHAEIINELTKIPSLSYRGMKIWYDQAVDLYPFGYPYAFVMNQMHQYILIFRKEE